MSLPVWLLGPMFLLGSLSRGVSVYTGSVSRGGLCPGDLYAEGSLSRGYLSGVSVQKSRWYASYWNAFLLYFILGRADLTRIFPVYLRKTLIFTDYLTGSGCWPCTLLEICEYQGHP